MGITYISLFLSDLLISNLVSSICALFFRLGIFLSNITRSIFLKQKFLLVLVSTEHKASRYKTFHYSYLCQSTRLQDLTSFLQIRLLFLTESFIIQVEYYTLGQQIYTRIFHSFGSDIRTELLLPQFPAITVSIPDNITIFWHRGRPRVQRYNNTPTKP
jgi:hypothetical protein